MATAAADLVQMSDNLKLLPEVLERINREIDRPGATTEDIGRVVSEDAGLIGRLLRLVNSAFYGYPGKVETLSHAITLLGTDQLRSIALAVSVIRVFEGIPCELVSMRSFWLHSLATATAARALAVHRCEENVERHFVAGLLHDVGSLVIYMKLPRRAKRVFKEIGRKSELLHVAETRTYGFHHGDVGRELLKAWKLPDVLQQTVGFHHRPSLCRRYPVEAAITHIADVIVGGMDASGNGECLVPPFQTAAWDLLDLDIAILPDLIDEIGANLSAVIAALLGDTSTND